MYMHPYILTINETDNEKSGFQVNFFLIIKIMNCEN